MTTLATLEYAPIELSRPSISEELSKLKLRRPSKHQAALLAALQSPDVSAEELHLLLDDPATAQLPAEIQGFAWAIYGVTLGDAGQLAGALEALERAIQLRPNYPDAHFNRGVALGRLGHYQEALEAYERAIQLRSDYTEALFNGGMALGRMGRHQEALKAFERVYHLRRTSSDVGERIYSAASYISLISGLSALERRWLPDLETSTKAFIKWRARARRDKQTAAFSQAVDGYTKTLQGDERLILDDFMLSVKLGSIKDPFKRWDAIAEEINKVWPSDLSAVEAIRRQRE